MCVKASFFLVIYDWFSHSASLWFDLSFCLFFFSFVFAEPSTEIIGAPDLYIESGSTINLTCVVHNSPEPPAFIFWNHNNAVSVAKCATLRLAQWIAMKNLKHIKDSWQQWNMQWHLAYLTIIIRFISFMSHWKHLLKMDFLLFSLPACLRSKVEILWPPCPLQRTMRKTRKKGNFPCDGPKLKSS